MRKSKRWLRGTPRSVAAAIVPLLALSLALLACWAVRPPRVATSLYDLIGPEAERIPKFVRDLSAREVSVIVSSPDRKAAEAEAEALRCRYTPAPMIPEGALDFLRRERAGLVAPETAQLLETPEGRAKITRRALCRAYTSPIPPLLGWRDDPFFLMDGFLASMNASRTTIETNGMTHILVKLTELPERVAGSPASADGGGTPSRTTPTISVALCGAPVHAARAATRCKREINALTLFSIVFIVLLSRLVFRSFKWIPLLACSLAVSALAGFLALTLCFAEIHIMTLVFATTILGLVIDYSYHALLADPQRIDATRRNLIVSFITTALTLLPLALSSIPILRQSAVFLGAGLSAALGYVLLVYPSVGRAAVADAPKNEVRREHSPKANPKGAQACARPPYRCGCHVGRALAPRAPRWADDDGMPPRPTPPRIGARVACVLLAVLALAGLSHLTIKTEITALYRPPADLLANEQLRATFGTFDLSAFPSLPERCRLAKLVRLLDDPVVGGDPRAPRPSSRTTPPPEPTFDFISPKAFVEGVLSNWTHSALIGLVVSLGAMLAVLISFFRKKALRVFAPSVASLLAVAGLLSLVGVDLNLFHLLAGFLLAGMGVDYTIFLHSGERAAMRSVTSALLTSVAGFGALAFVSMPIVASFGQVLGMGLPISFVIALALMPDPIGRTSGESVEHAASPIGLEILWLVYAAFGLHALHLASALVGVSAWLFSSAVRRASPSVRKVIAFTGALADKLVVMAGGRHQPAVVLDDHADARTFLDDVRAGRGVFVLSSHVGTIEVLAALGACARSFHAWMDFSRTSVFTRFYMKHAHRSRVIIHPTSAFDIGAVFEAGTLLDEGECVLMAGDRGEGAFRFAATFDHPVYFVACLAEGRCRYRAMIRRLPSERKTLKAKYGEILADLASRYPEQDFNWHLPAEGNK